MAFVYILYSKILDKFYIGYTSTSVEERLAKHLQRHKGFTATTKDWEVVYTEEFPDNAQACARERQIKNWTSKQKIRELIGYCDQISWNRVFVPVAQIYAVPVAAIKKLNARYRGH